MKSTASACEETPPSFPPAPAPLPAEENNHLREILKRCPVTTYAAACQFRQSGDPRHLPAIVLGIIERFVEPDLRPKLRNPPDSLCLIEDLGLDSLCLMEVVFLVEDVLAVPISNDELRRLRTVGDIRHFLEGKLPGPADGERRPAGG
jgi:3-hydroxyacyl-[acyl-carrier-protein] dehydratase